MMSYQRFIALAGSVFAFAVAVLMAPAVWAAEQAFVIGFAQDNMANAWRATQVRHAEEALKPYPGVRFIHTDAMGNTAQQILDIENLVAKGIDLLITSPRDGAAMTLAITRVYEKGSPVVLLTRQINSDAYTIFIGGDDYDIGQRAARHLVENHKDAKHILILAGVPTATTAINRTNGFLDEIKNHSGFHIAGIKPANYLTKNAIIAVEQALQEGLKFDAIYAESDSMAVGARLALKKAGIDPASIPTVGIDYISEARDAIRKGVQSATFIYPTVAREGIEYAMKILAGEKVPKEILVQSQIITRDNVEQIAPIF